MSTDEFKEGRLYYTVTTGMTPESVAEVVGLECWQNGFVAFANAEKKLAELKGIDFDTDFFTGRIQKLNNAEGYVTEINFWGRKDQRLVEIVAEREENTYVVQTWSLDTEPAAGTGNCWHREASTNAGSHHKEGQRVFSGELKTVEVVWPEKRLNFFITKE